MVHTCVYKSGRVARRDCLPVVVLTIFLLAAASRPAQSQALNGQIEGSVVDQAGAAVASASITATNIETGALRYTVSDKSGVYRFPLLPLGTYRVWAEASGFRRLIHTGVTVVAGQTAVIDLRLLPGEIVESVTVSRDAPVADPGKSDLSRVMDYVEVHNIPLPTRNPYNFAVLQSNVTGQPNRGFNYPQLNVNGFARRVNYLLDGNTNTQGDRAGARLMRISETYVSEVRLLTGGFAAEFGNTTGMIVNMVTPSGTNDIRGSALYLFGRPSFYARPFFFSGARLPDNSIDDIAATLGGPIIKDRWHFYFGFETLRRRDNTRPNSQVRISAENRLQLVAAGLPSSIFVPAIPSYETGLHFIFRTDGELNGNNRLSLRFNSARVNFGAVAGGFNTTERRYDPRGIDHSLGLQLISFKSEYLNEFRFQFTRSSTVSVRNKSSGNGPSIAITDVANFGSPPDAPTVNPLAKVTQLQNNFSWTRTSHSIKLGGGISFFNNFTRAAVASIYTFPSIKAYLLARNGTNPYSYTRYDETFGDPEIKYRSAYWNFFAQDEWRAGRKLKLNYGVRYDLYEVPDADPNSPLLASRKFNTDSNNFAPRFGLVYALRSGNRPLVLRAGAGIYYEPPWTDMYAKALRNNGDPKFFNLTFRGTNDGLWRRDTDGPAFPDTFSGSRPPSSALPEQNIITIAPDFESMYAIHSSVQIEQALTNDLCVSVGYVHSGGRHIPVYRSINAFDPIRYLADGRPVFGTARLDPRFKVIQMAESAGVSQYDAFTVQLSQRFFRGIQFSANYTLSRALDDAPEQEVTYDDGSRNLRALSDPTNRSFDKGYSYGDQRHAFVMTLVARPSIAVRTRALRAILNGNQIGVIARANSGERFGIRTKGDVDLNRDGLFWPDRPVGIKRNSGKTPPQFNLDLRYSRFINFDDRYKLEFFGEFQNLFNINNIVGFNDLTVPVDPFTGQMIGPMPDFETTGAPKSLESRQVQIGIKFHF